MIRSHRIVACEPIPSSGAICADGDVTVYDRFAGVDYPLVKRLDLPGDPGKNFAERASQVLLDRLPVCASKLFIDSNEAAFGVDYSESNRRGSIELFDLTKLHSELAEVGLEFSNANLFVGKERRLHFKASVSSDWF
jgi:hypothetical protein